MTNFSSKSTKHLGWLAVILFPVLTFLLAFLGLAIDSLGITFLLITTTAILFYLAISTAFCHRVLAGRSGTILLPIILVIGLLIYLNCSPRNFLQKDFDPGPFDFSWTFQDQTAYGYPLPFYDSSTNQRKISATISSTSRLYCTIWPSWPLPVASTLQQ